MSTKDLCAKYGGNSRDAVRRAIRAEIPGGPEALDGMAELHGLSQNEAAVAIMRRVIAAQEAEVRKRYDMPPAPSRPG